MSKKVTYPKNCSECGRVYCDHPRGEEDWVKVEVMTAMLISDMYQPHIEEIAKQAKIGGISFLSNPLIYSGLGHLLSTDTLVVSDEDEEQPLLDLQEAIKSAARQQGVDVPQMKIFTLTVLPRN